MRAIKGIWCVPKYSNPQGYVYSDETVRRMASLKPAAKDFRVFWDNAYAMHHLYREEKPFPNILEECEKAGNPDMSLSLCPLSKISFAGAGIAAMASSRQTGTDARKSLVIQTTGMTRSISLRHVRFLRTSTA